jgi:hypothetical protein
MIVFNKNIENQNIMRLYLLLFITISFNSFSQNIRKLEENNAYSKF